MEMNEKKIACDNWRVVMRDNVMRDNSILLSNETTQNTVTISL